MTMEDQKNICRICLNVIQNNTFTYVDDENGYIQNVGSIRELIQFCIPELDLYVSTNPIVCHQCLPSMVTVYNFKNKCLHVESIIRNYIIRNNLQDYNFVNLNCVIMDEVKIKSQLVETKIQQYMKCQDKEELSEDSKQFKPDSVSESILGTRQADIVETLVEINNDQGLLDENIDSSNVEDPAERQDVVQKMEIGINDCNDIEDTLITDIKCEESEIIEQNIDPLELPQTRIVIKIDRTKLDMDNIVSNTDSDTDNIISPSSSHDTTQMPSSATHEDISSTTSFNTSDSPLFTITSTTTAPDDEQVLPLRLYQCKPCNFVTTDIKNVSMHNNMYHSSGFLCTMCPFSTTKLDLLSKHITSAHGFDQNDVGRDNHSGSRTLHACEMCSFKTNLPDMMTSHKINTHANNIITVSSSHFSNLFDCPHCAYKTTGLYLLNKHIETKHEKKSEFQCEHCSYATKDKSNFRKHVFTHGTKPMQCLNCTYKCVSPYQMRRHVKKNHEKADLNNYKLSVDYFSKVNGNLNLTGQLSA